MLELFRFLAFIGYSMAQSVCNNIKDHHGNCIAEGCQIWFDGCQTCAIAYDGETKYVNMGCTGEICKKMEKAKCVDPRYHEGDDCRVKPIPCTWDNVCPVMREITHCSQGGIKGYTTYELSLELKKDVYNVYVMYGTHDNTMYIPPAKNEYSLLGSNIGGVNPIYYNKQHNGIGYDSWLTIGITGGDMKHELSSIGIKFDNWSAESPLIVDNGAIFLINARQKVVTGNNLVIGHLTVKNDMSDIVNINVQGYKKLGKRLIPWTTNDIKFPIEPLTNDSHNGH